MGTMTLLCDGLIRCKVVGNRYIRHGFVASAKACKLRHLRIYSEAGGRWLHLEVSKLASSTESSSGKTIIFHKVDLIRRNFRVAYGAGVVIGATTVNLVGKSQTDIEGWLDRIRDAICPIPFEEKVRGKAFVVSVIDERRSLRSKLTGRLVVHTNEHDVAFLDPTTGLSSLIAEWHNVIKVETAATKQDEDEGRVFKLQIARPNKKKPLVLTVYCKDGQRFIAEFQRRKAVAVVRRAQPLPIYRNGTMPVTKSAKTQRFFRSTSSSRDDSNRRPSVVHYPKTRAGPLGSIKSWIRRSLPSLLVDDIPESPPKLDSTTTSDDDDVSIDETQLNDSRIPQVALFDSTKRIEYEQLFPGLSARNSAYSAYSPKEEQRGIYCSATLSSRTPPSHYPMLSYRQRTMTVQSESAADPRVRNQPSYINLQQLSPSSAANNGKHTHYASLSSIMPTNTHRNL